MVNISRRSLLQTMGMSALGVSLGSISLAMTGEGSSEEVMSNWLDTLFVNSAKLGNRQTSGLQWQSAMDGIYAAAPLDPLKKKIGFENSLENILDHMPAERGELFYEIKLPGSANSKTADGREAHRALITKIAHIRKGRSIPPHGHSNMVSAFLCLSGEFEVQQFDRLEDHDDHMIIRQATYEKKAGVGTWSSISDYRNNVHWLTAKSDDCFLFTSKLLNLEDNRKLKGRMNIDVHRAVALGSGMLKAPKITFRQAAELY